MKRLTLLLSLVGVLLAVSMSEAGSHYVIILDGANENPPHSTLGTGSGVVDIDTIGNNLHVNVTFSGLTSNTIMAHIHCCIAPPGNTIVATPLPAFPGFPLGGTSGSYDGVLDMTQTSSWNPAFIAAHGGTTSGAEAALASGALAGQAYFNIHTTNFPGGEIRAFLVLTPEGPTEGIPTLSGWALLALGVLLALSTLFYLRKRPA
ncbi:MAG TPA: CHRD domain-containing protein [Candidatus Methylomirabilis sp.]|nr:CHRD domain-containing protein [Candidatus Methylomirabilis sp.]